VFVLIGAAALAGAIGDIKDAVVILIVVVFNACLGFYQEYRAEATLAALKKMLAQRARVRRGGEVQEIAAEDLVPGDIVMLEAGDRISRRCPRAGRAQRRGGGSRAHRGITRRRQARRCTAFR